VRCICRKGFIERAEKERTGSTATVALGLMFFPPPQHYSEWAAALASALPTTLEWAASVNLPPADAPSCDQLPTLQRLVSATAILREAKDPAAYGTAMLGPAAGLDVPDALRLTLQLAKKLDAELGRMLAAISPPGGSEAATCRIIGLASPLHVALDGVRNLLEFRAHNMWLAPAPARKTILKLLASAVARVGQAPNYWCACADLGVCSLLEDCSADGWVAAVSAVALLTVAAAPADECQLVQSLVQIPFRASSSGLTCRIRRVQGHVANAARVGGPGDPAGGARAPDAAGGGQPGGGGGSRPCLPVRCRRRRRRRHGRRRRSRRAP